MYKIVNNWMMRTLRTHLRIPRWGGSINTIFLSDSFSVCSLKIFLMVSTLLSSLPSQTMITFIADVFAKLLIASTNFFLLQHPNFPHFFRKIWQKIFRSEKFFSSNWIASNLTMVQMMVLIKPRTIPSNILADRGVHTFCGGGVCHSES